MLCVDWPGSDLWNRMHVARWEVNSKSNAVGAYGHSWRHVLFQNLGEFVHGYPTHWMPLPPPPAP